MNALDNSYILTIGMKGLEISILDAFPRLCVEKHRKALNWIFFPRCFDVFLEERFGGVGPDNGRVE